MGLYGYFLVSGLMKLGPKNLYLNTYLGGTLSISIKCGQKACSWLKVILGLLGYIIYNK